MDAYEATQVVFARVQAQDPENVSKIIGYLLLQDRSEQEMARLALGSEALLQSAIAQARRELGICGSPPPLPQHQFNHGDLSAAHLLNLQQQQQQQNERIVQLDRLNRPSPLYIPDSVGYSIPSPHEQQNPLIHDKLMAELSATSKISSLNHHNHHHHHHLHNNHHQQQHQHQQQQQQLFGSSMHHHNPLLMPADSHPSEFQQQADWYFNNNSNDSPTYYNSMLKPGFGYANASKRHLLSSNNASSSGSHDFPSSPSSAAAAAAAAAVALAWKPCLYYSRGYCKHGTNCRFLHGSLKDGSPQGSPGSSSNGGQCSLFLDDDIPSGSLERLEMELQELLRGRRTPISIASLPQLYYEKFGKTLQAEGYLTESQRHGRVGYSLTKLLARLKGSVVLIDRPHGQHAVVLAEDAQRFVGYRAERDDLKDANPSSRQIYLTFPAESTFTEEDVSSHFRAYGPVQDVRIPYQQKRMFGFVTFLYPETVKTILSEGNPHYICGARVLVKPYREKAKPNERKQPEKVDPLRAPQFRSLSGKDFMQDASANLYDAFARRFEEERMLELERRRLVELHALRARAADAETEAERNSPLLNGIHGDSSEVPSTPQAGEHNNGINEAAMTAEEMQQFQSSNPFGFVMDVLDGEMGDEAEDSTSDSKVNVQQQSSNTESSKSNGHNLPDNLFASSNENSVSLPEDQLTYSLQEKMMGMNLNEVLTMASLPMPAPTVTQKDLICCICLEDCVEPSKLECNHTFCVQCILKVIRGSKDECPICRQHIGSQVYKILQNKDLQSWLSPTTVSHRVAQHIW